MEKPPVEVITCPGCGSAWPKTDLDRECSNCFACTGCEIYLCPECGKEIVIKPVRLPSVSTPSVEPDSK